MLRQIPRGPTGSGLQLACAPPDTLNAMSRSSRRVLPGVLLLILTGSLISGCGSTARPTPVVQPAAPALVLPATVRVRTAGRVVTVPLEDYVLGTALSEVSPVSESADTTRRIFEVQAVLARTYVASHLGRHAQEGFDVCDETHCQLYEPARIGTSRFSTVAREAVLSTRGEVLTYADRLTEALFHSDCGGHTAAADQVWGGRAVPYLVGTPDDVPQETHRRWQIVLPAERVRQALNNDTRSAVGRRLTAIQVTARDDSGRATTVEVRGDTTRELRGEQLRAVLNQTFGRQAIQSTRFELAHAASGFRFSGTGYGHGVGLCQVGAAARARRGESVSEILAAYFPGAQTRQTRQDPVPASR
jgi:stage II sporulation protein D